MIRFARIFEHAGNRFIHPDYAAKTRKAAGAGAADFAAKLGIDDTRESMEFADGAPIPNRRVMLFPPAKDEVSPAPQALLCIDGPLLASDHAEVWVGDSPMRADEFAKLDLRKVANETESTPQPKL